MFLKSCREMNGSLVRVEKCLDNGRYEVRMHSSTIYPSELKTLPLRNLVEAQDKWTDKDSLHSAKEQSFSAEEKNFAKTAPKNELQELINRKLSKEK